MANKVASLTVEIRTAQQVLVSYELATVFQRIMAGFIDSAFVWAFQLLRWMVFPPETADFWNLLFSTFTLIWMAQLGVVIFLNGRSPGMRIMGIRILGLDGTNLEFSDYFLRWIIRPIDITLSFTSVGIFSMLTTEKRQRLGDLLAGTAVIRLIPKTHFTLRDIQAFHQHSAQDQVRYPGVRFIEESNMLFIKNLLQNPAGYSLEVQQAALQDATHRFADLLQLQEIPENPRVFLSQLVNDYIVLTR